MTETPVTTYPHTPTPTHSHAHTPSFLDGLVARPLPLFVGILLVFVVAFGASIFLVPRRYGRLITGDGIYYYVWLRSAVIDH